MNISNKTFSIGGRTFDYSEIQAFESGTTGVILYAQLGTAGQFTTARKANGTAGFQVPAGKTLTVKAMVCMVNAGASTGAACPLYGDTDVGQASGSAPTTPIYLGGFATTRMMIAQTYSNANTQTYQSASILDFQVPQNKYLAFVGSTATESIMVYCTIA